MNDGIVLRNDSASSVESARLVRAAQAVLDAQTAFQCASLTIVVSDSKAIRRLNLKHAGVDAPTDVLSFPADEAPGGSGGLDPYLGDIVIASDYVAEQARNTGAPVNDILCLLAIHGTLHLLGYDHDTNANKDEMWAAQDHALRALNIEPGIIVKYERGEHD